MACLRRAEGYSVSSHEKYMSVHEAEISVLIRVAFHLDGRRISPSRPDATGKVAVILCR